MAVTDSYVALCAVICVYAFFLRWKFKGFFLGFLLLMLAFCRKTGKKRWWRCFKQTTFPSSQADVVLLLARSDRTYANFLMLSLLSFVCDVLPQLR